MPDIGSAVAGGSAILGAIGGSKGGSSKQKVQNDPWKGVQPYLKDIYSLAQQQYGQAPQYYPEQTFAPFDPLQIAGQEMAMKYVTGNGALPPMQMPNMPTQVPFQMGAAGAQAGGGLPQMPFGPQMGQSQQNMIPMPGFNLSPQQQNVGGYVPPPPQGAVPPGGAPNMPAVPDLASILASIYQGLPF